MSNKSVKAVLCGDLNMLRCFVDAEIPTIVVSSDPKDITFNSRYCQHKEVVANPLKESDKTVQDLVKLGERFSEKPVLFYGDDTMLLLISRNRKLLAKYYRFLLPEPDVVEGLVDKIQFARLSDSLGFTVPRTIVSNQIKNIGDVMKYLSPPGILKPKTHIEWFRSNTIMENGGKPRKALKFNDLDEFKYLYNSIKKFTDEFVIQEYIEGGADNIYSFHAYLNAHLEPLAYYVGRKIRTYPKESGVSTYIELVEEPEVVRLGLDILKKLNFVGIVKIDFKRDIRRGRFYLLEINPRFNLWNYLGAVCGINLPLIVFFNLLGQNSIHYEDYRTDVRWLSFGSDLRTFLRDYRKEDNLSIGGWLLSFKGKKIYDIFSWRDPYPLIISFSHYLKALFRRIVKKILH